MQILMSATGPKSVGCADGLPISVLHQVRCWTPQKGGMASGQVLGPRCRGKLWCDLLFLIYGLNQIIDQILDPNCCRLVVFFEICSISIIFGDLIFRRCSNIDGYWLLCGLPPFFFRSTGVFWGSGLFWGNPSWSL